MAPHENSTSVAAPCPTSIRCTRMAGRAGSRPSKKLASIGAIGVRGGIGRAGRAAHAAIASMTSVARAIIGRWYRLFGELRGEPLLELVIRDFERRGDGLQVLPLLGRDLAVHARCLDQQ